MAGAVTIFARMRRLPLLLATLAVAACEYHEPTPAEKAWAESAARARKAYDEAHAAVGQQLNSTAPLRFGHEVRGPDYVCGEVGAPGIFDGRTTRYIFRNNHVVFEADTPATFQAAWQALYCDKL